MTYTAPDAASLKARYPEFVSVQNALIDLVMADAFNQVGDTWMDRDRARAQLLLTAHLLAVEGEPQRSADIAAGKAVSPVNTPMKRRKVGDVEVGFQNANEQFGSNASQAMSAAAYETTRYGREFKVLMMKNFPAVAVV